MCCIGADQTRTVDCQVLLSGLTRPLDDIVAASMVAAWELIFEARFV